MRIAVLVYGRLNKCVEHYNNILEHIGKQHDIDFFLSSDNSPESILHDFIHLYKPISYDNTPILYDYDLAAYPRAFETNIHNMTCHFLNKNRVFALLEKYIIGTYIHYDVVLSLRIDLVFNNSFDFNGLLDNTIYIPSDFDYRGINDQIAYGKIDVMKKYNYINPIYLLENKFTISNPECLTLANICVNNLLVQRVELSYYIDK